MLIGTRTPTLLPGGAAVMRWKPRRPKVSRRSVSALRAASLGVPSTAETTWMPFARPEPTST